MEDESGMGTLVSVDEFASILNQSITNLDLAIVTTAPSSSDNINDFDHQQIAKVFHQSGAKHVINYTNDGCTSKQT